MTRGSVRRRRYPSDPCIRLALSLSAQCGHNWRYDACGRRGIRRLCRAGALGARRRAVRALARGRHPRDGRTRATHDTAAVARRARVRAGCRARAGRRADDVADPGAPARVDPRPAGGVGMADDVSRAERRGASASCTAAPMRPRPKRSSRICRSTNPPSRPRRPTTSPVACGIAVGTLNERCQRLLRIVAFEERPDYARIAEDLAMPIGSIGPTRQRCLAKLRALLEGDGWGGDDDGD